MYLDRNNLINNAIILDSQLNCNNLNNYYGILGKYRLSIIKSEDGYILKNERKHFLYIYNDILEFVNDDDSDNFKKNSKFLILSDKICFSIFPYYNQNYIICLYNNNLKIKKIISCIYNNYTTIFKLFKEEKNQKINKKKFIPNKLNKEHLVQMNSLNECFLKNNKDFIIITPNKNQVPKYFKENIYDSKLKQCSILFLDYIISHYENLCEKILFVNEYSKLTFNIEKKLLSPNKIFCFTDLNYRITLDGLRFKYIKNSIWSNWDNIKISNKKDISQPYFIKLLIKKLPTTSYLEYSSNYLYFISKDKITKNTKTYYLNILKYLYNNPSKIEIMDRCWYYVFN